MSARHCAPLILRLCPSCIHPLALAIHTWHGASSLPARRYLKKSSPGSENCRTSIVEHRDGADRRAGALAPFQRQADELKFALPEQRLEIAQAFHMRDVEFEASFMHQRIDFTFRPRP